MIKNSIKLASLLTVIVFGLFAFNSGPSNKFFEIAKNIEIFSNIYKEINLLYVDELEPSELMQTGIDAMLESLDPYTNYITESQIESFRFLTQGKYKGIGGRSRAMDGYPTLVEIYKNSPADVAMMKVGDKILSINGKEASGKTFEEVEAILKGSPGSQIDFKVKRQGYSSPLDITLIRDNVVIDNVPYYGMLDKDVAYINLTTFTQNAGKNIQNALKELKEKNTVKGLVLDLRNNGGGLLMEAVNISNIFVDKGELVVSTKGKSNEWDKTFLTTKVPYDKDIKIAVLINDRSASASEIVSGVIQDLDRGVLIGQRSYGKGLVQNTKDVGYNSKVKLTTAKYYIPSGRCIQAVEYKDGEPIDIPESERGVFYTKNGRKVLDGGGVKPDLVMDKKEEDDFMKAIKKDYVLFKFVDQHFAGKDSIAQLKEYKFDEWNAFKAYLENTDFQFETQLEEQIYDLEQTASKDKIAIEDLILPIKKKIKEEKNRSLEANKTTLISMIEMEVANKYGYQKAKVQMNLRNDPEVDKAIEVLTSDEYSELLKN